MATNNDGSTKAKAIVDKAETVTVDAAKVTDLSISRAGKVYTATWKNASTYSSIKIKYRLKKDGNWYPWTNYVTLGSSDTSKAFVTINYSDYHPYIPTYLRMMEVGVLVDQENKTETVYEKKKNKKGKQVWHKHTKTTKYTSKLATCTYDLWDPKKPQLSVADGLSETTFTLKVPNSNTDGNNVTTKITKWTKSIENWGTKDPATNYDWANETEYKSMTGKYSSDTRTFTHTLGAADVAQGKSYTVMAKAIAQGPNGDPTTTYSSIVYAYPKVASNIKTSVVNSGSTQYKVTISWDKNEDSTHPCKRYKIQYYIGTPANTSMGIPSSGVSWANATEYINCQSGVKQTTTIFTPRIGDEQCLWIRVIQNNVQTMETPSSAVLAKSFSTLVAPTIESITYDAVTHLLTVSVDSNTNLDGVVSYVFIGTNTYTVPASGVLSITRAFSVVNVSWGISARNYFGSIASSANVQYFDPSRDASNPIPYVPTGLSASKIGTTGNIKLTWTPVLKGVTSSRITVADNSQEWSYASPDFVQDITIEGSAASAIINGLELGASYYFRVQSTNSHGTTGYSAIYGPVKLSAADVPSPNISLQETADHGIRVSWNWNDWTSARGIQISWSTDKNDRDGSNPFEILKGLSAGAQTYTIPPLNLERGETWYVWAWFTSGNARSTPDEEHILLPIPMSAPTNLSLSRAAQNTDEEGKTTARLSWRNNTSTENTTSIEVSWSDNPHAWETTSGAETYDSESIINTILIPELTLGKTWYARVRTIYNEKHYVWSAIASIDLRTTPSTPRISVSKNLVSQYGSVDFSWSYENEDLSEQASATVRIYNSSNVLVGNATVANSDKAVTVYCEQIGLVGDQDYYATVQTTSANGRSSGISDAVYFTVVNVPIASITSTSLVDEIVGDNPQTYTGEIVQIDNSEDITSVRSLNVSLEPIQDLHGYDKPWSGGAGKNKSPIATWSGHSGIAVTLENAIPANTTITVSGLFTRDGTATNNCALLFKYSDDTLSGWYNIAVNSGQRKTQTVTLEKDIVGINYYSSNDGWSASQNYTLTVTDFQIELGSTATSYAPYSNICPISGRTECDTEVVGKNVIKAKYSGRTHNGITYVVNADGTITASGTATGTSYAINNISGNRTLLLHIPKGTYRLTGGIDASKPLYLGGLYDDGTAFTTVYDRGSGATYTFTKDAWVYPQIVITNGTTIDATFNIQLEVGSTSSEFEPYNGTSYTTDLGRTVYGGSLDVTTGELVVDRAMDTVDTSRISNNGTLPYGGLQILYNPLTAKKYGTQAEPYHGLLSNRFNPSSTSSGGEVNGRPTNGYIYFNMPSSVTTIELARQWFTDNPTQICYELAQPQTYQLTPTEVSLLLGANNVWADGNIEVKTLDAPRQVKALKELPLSVTVGGVPTNGTCIVYIERSKTIQLARPDESTSYGYEGELVVVAEGTNQVSITQEMLQTDFTDGGEYRVYAIALNQLGTKSDPATLDFTVAWTHQAIKPTATYVVDPDLYIAKITPIEPEGALETDTFDIYRLSADKPELIVQGGEWGTTYVDPYVTLGDNAGHRVVMRTENGDYTTAENEIAWLDLIPPNGTGEPFLDNEAAIIDFDGQQVEIEHNLDTTHSWEKDFTETKYLGGSIQGDWNPAVSRKASMGAVMIKLIEASDIIKMKRLAAYAGVCHVRTPDGSSFTANVSVTEAWSTNKDWGFAEYTLDITRVDAETLDGMTLAEWGETHGVG